MTTPIPETDPLASYESRPSVSFNKPTGGYGVKEIARLVVQDWPKLIVDRDPETKEVNFWPQRPGDKEPKAKQKLVINVLDTTDTSEEGGVEKTLWAKPVRKGKALFAAIQTAQAKVQKDTGDKAYRLKPGDTLEVMYVGDDHTVAPKMGNYPKQFAARIIVGEAPPADTSDPFSDQSPAQPAAAGKPAAATSDADPWGGSGGGSAAASAAASAGDDPWGAPDLGDEPPF